jgi:putative SOS response-associated peptidase YedK
MQSDRRLLNVDCQLCQQLDAALLAERFQLVSPLPALPAVVAPLQPLVALVRTERGCCSRYYRWGLLPDWARSSALGVRLLYARLEVVNQNPLFRSAMRETRCLVPVSAITLGEAGRRRQWLAQGEEPLLVAALTTHWHRGVGEAGIDGCALLTLASSDGQRQPLLLSRDEYRDWLEEVDSALLVSRLLADRQEARAGDKEISGDGVAFDDSDPSVRQGADQTDRH